jgi:protein FRG1
VKIQNKYKKEANDEEKKKKEGVVGETTIDEAGTKQVLLFLSWKRFSTVAVKYTKRGVLEGQLFPQQTEKKFVLRLQTALKY